MTPTKPAVRTLCTCRPKQVHQCGMMTLGDSYSSPHPCVKEVAKRGDVCAHHRKYEPHRRKP